MQSPNKRPRLTPPLGQSPPAIAPPLFAPPPFAPPPFAQDFVSLDAKGDYRPSTFAGQAYQHGFHQQQLFPQQEFRPNGPGDFHDGGRGGHHQAHQRRQPDDRPKSKHALPGHERWLLIKTKFGRRFVHNTDTKESFWRIPKDVMPGVAAFDEWATAETEKRGNAQWAEEQLKQMRQSSAASGANNVPIANERSRRRRSESLQREDEEAVMRELAAQEESNGENVKTYEPPVLQRDDVKTAGGYESDSSYEEVEVTDSEGEEREPALALEASGDAAPADPEDDAPLEFNEDDIAYQLLAMGEDYGLDPEEYGAADDEEGDRPGGEGADTSSDQALSERAAQALFRDMLDEHHVNPYTPFDALTSSATCSLLADDRYTALPSTRARKQCWDAWTRGAIARLRSERAHIIREDPKISYLALLAEHATPKLYWPEFKRRHKRDSALTDRALGDKEREKLYREFVARLRLPAAVLEVDLRALLAELPLKVLNGGTRTRDLPGEIRGDVRFMAVAPRARAALVAERIAALPPAPEPGAGEAGGG